MFQSSLKDNFLINWSHLLLLKTMSLDDQDIRREEINKKLEEAEQKEKEELSTQRKELFTERRAKQAELRLLQRKVDMAELVMKMIFFMKVVIE